MNTIPGVITAARGPFRRIRLEDGTYDLVRLSPLETRSFEKGTKVERVPNGRDWTYRIVELANGG